jgi:hypothetical protein
MSPDGQSRATKRSRAVPGSGREVSPRGTTIAQRFAADFEDLREHDRQHPGETSAIVAHLVAHLRAWRPEAVSPLGTLPPPSTPIVDPRAKG